MLQNKKLVISLFLLSLFLFSAGISSRFLASKHENLGARTDSFWFSVGSYIRTSSDLGYNILINGVDKYLNFGSVSGTSGYGIRDNNGTLEFKNSGGSWSSSFGGGIALTDLSNTATGLTYNNLTGVTSLTSGYEIPKTASTSNWQTAYGWGNHASQGYITDGNTGWTNEYGLITLSSLSSTATGLSYDNGTGVISLTSGYVIPLSASTTDWDTAYNERATWNGSTVANGTITNLTVTGTTTLQSALVDSASSRGILNNILISTGTSTRWVVATTTGLLISGGTLTSAYHCRYDGVGIDCDRVEDASGDCGANAVCMGGHTHTAYAALAGPALTGNASAANLRITGVLQIPTSTAFSTATSGAMAIDTTSNQLRYFGTATSTLSPLLTPAFTIASTTLVGGASTSTIPLGPAGYAETWSSAICGSVGGTGVGTTTLRFGDGTNWTNTLTVTSTPYDLTLSSNNTFTLAEWRYLQVITTAGSPNYISCSVHKFIDPD